MKKTNNLLVLSAGPAGNGRSEYLDEVRSNFSRQGIELGLHSVFSYMQKVGKQKGVSITRENVLDLEPAILDPIRNEAIETIAKKIKDDKKGFHIVSSPIYREWSGGPKEALTLSQVRKLDPDIFVVIIDDLIRVREELMKDPQWKGQEFTLETLATWRLDEIERVM